MKKLNLLVMLFALLVTACSDSETEDPNGGGGNNGGDKTNIIGLNIKNAKLIYGVEQSSTRSMLKSSSSSNFYRQVTKENQNLSVNWITATGDTTSVVAIEAMANINDDYLIINTRNLIDEPTARYKDYLGYIVNKNTGAVLNPSSPIRNIDLINTNDYTSYYDGDKYCYIKGVNSTLLKINLQSYSVEQIFEGSDDVKILPSGSYFVHMRDGNHKYGNFRINTIEEFSDIEKYRGWDNYIPVYGAIDRVITIICNKKNTDGSQTYSSIAFSAGEHPAEYGFSDRLDEPKHSFTSNFELPKGIVIGGPNITPISVNTSRTTQIIYIGSSDGRYGILINYDAWNGLTQLPDELFDGFISGKRYTNYERDVYPNIASNSNASFNSKENGELVITEFNTMTQKTVKDAKGYRISAIVEEKITDAKPITFIGEKLQENKRCIGTIDEKGNAEILQEFIYGDNESMTGFLMKLN